MSNSNPDHQESHPFFCAEEKNLSPDRLLNLQKLSLSSSFLESEVEAEKTSSLLTTSIATNCCTCKSQSIISNNNNNNNSQDETPSTVSTLISSIGIASLQSNEPTKFDQLSDDCLLHVFYHLSVVEKAQLQRVCNRWMRLLDYRLRVQQSRLTIWYPCDNDVQLMRSFRRVHRPHLLSRHILNLFDLWLLQFSFLRKLRLLCVQFPVKWPDDGCMFWPLGNRLNHLALLYCNCSVNAIIDQATRHCRELKELELLCTSIYSLNESTLNRAIVSFPKLNSLRIGFVWNNLGWSHPVRCERLPSIAGRLKLLQLNDCSGLSPSVFQSILQAAAQGQQLRALHFEMRNGIGGEELTQICHSFPCLQSLVICISRLNCVKEDHLVQISKLHELRRLELVMRCQMHLSDNKMRQIMSGCPRMKLFGIVHFSPLLSEQTLLDIAMCWPMLETLIFRCNHEINPQALMHLRSMHQLKRLYLFNYDIGDQMCYLLPALPTLHFLDVRSAKEISPKTMEFMLNWFAKRPTCRFELVLSDKTKVDLRRYKLHLQRWPLFTIYRLSDSWTFDKYSMVMHENFRHFYETI